MAEPFTFAGSGPSPERVTLAELEQLDGGPPTLVRVSLAGDGLHASCVVNTDGGDGGHDPHASVVVDGVTELASTRLSRLLIDPGSGSRWDGPKRWQTFSGALLVEATIDSGGHVALGFRLAPERWGAVEETWSASVIVRYALGELIEVGGALEAWVDSQFQR